MAEQHGSKAETEEHERLYEASGIRERHGRVNRWLIVVYALLAVWGIYYLVKY